MTDDYQHDDRRFVSVLRSARREGMYLYVERGAGLDRVPDELRTLFGAPQPALDLVLTPQRKLARANAAEVLAAIREQGYYLQLPPQADEEMRALALRNDKLPPR